jgi:hypothetical protein
LIEFEVIGELPMAVPAASGDLKRAKWGSMEAQQMRVTGGFKAEFARKRAVYSANKFGPM